jgi:hypothetical protein
MKTLVSGAIAAVALVTLPAAPALAGDLLYRAAPDSLTEDLSNKPYWMAQAQCAGFFGATSQYLDQTGDSDGARQAGDLAVKFANDAIARLMKDRKLTRAQAMDLISPSVLKARNDGATLVSTDTSSTSTWNFARSVCLDVADAYATQTRW